MPSRSSSHALANTTAPSEASASLNKIPLTPATSRRSASRRALAGLPPDARPLDRGKPRDENTEGGNQPADKSLINRRLSLHSPPCAAMPLLADGELAEQALNHASPLDREHKKLGRRCSRWPLYARAGDCAECGSRPEPTASNISRPQIVSVSAFAPTVVLRRIALRNSVAISTGAPPMRLRNT
jgi:hypothetical protein